MTQTTFKRRYDIDWLRVLAFGVLIFYHIGMYYVEEWGWHIKSEFTYLWLQDVMILSNQWRMSLMFFISAVALSLALKSRSSIQLLSLRSTRLLIPLIFGMAVIVAPQVYIEALNNHLISASAWQFWLAYLGIDSSTFTQHQIDSIALTWNHLWFIPYLWVYSAIALAFNQSLNRLCSSQWFVKTPTPVALFLIVLTLACVWITLRKRFPTTHDLAHDWYSHGKYFLVFVFGFIFARQPIWWRWVINNCHKILIFALFTYSLIIADRHDLIGIGDYFSSELTEKAIAGTVLSLNHWAWLLAVVGLAGRWLNHNNAFLRYANQAVLPWYIFHQTWIIIFAWQLKPYHLNTAVEFFLLLTMTTLACWLGYEGIRRARLSCWLFGIVPMRSNIQKSGNRRDSIEGKVFTRPSL